jgi:nitroreductase
MCSVGIAAQTIMLAAKSIDHDTTPMDGFDFDAFGKLINLPELPEDHTVAMFIVEGVALEASKLRPTQLPMDEIVIHNSF